jgi:hypothetical protein
VHQTATAPHAPLTAVHDDVEWLRGLLDRQPACVMRVGLEGTMLAVSEAAVSLLGGRSLADVLDKTLLARLQGDAERLWNDFVARVLYGGSASMECELDDLTGTRRAVILQGVSLPTHTDGVESLLVAFREVSTARRLEASLEEQESLRRSAQEDLRKAQEEIQQLQARLDEVTVDRNRLHVMLEQVVNVAKGGQS